MTDNLNICPCGKSDACYVTENSPEIKTYSCFGCGFMSNSLMKEGEEFYQQQLEILPELYKDIIFEDDNGLKWIPNNINSPTKGMVFYNGTDASNACWAAVKAIKINEDEKEKYPIKGKPGEYYEYRMDMSTMKSFDKYDFISALDYIEVLE